MSKLAVRLSERVFDKSRLRRLGCVSHLICRVLVPSREPLARQAYLLESGTVAAPDSARHAWRPLIVFKWFHLAHLWSHLLLLLLLFKLLELLTQRIKVRRARWLEPATSGGRSMTKPLRQVAVVSATLTQFLVFNYLSNFLSSNALKRDKHQPDEPAQFRVRLCCYVSLPQANYPHKVSCCCCCFTLPGR